jgi:energy-coupling factor transporter ATP-binding protein EcfA2
MQNTINSGQREEAKASQKKASSKKGKRDKREPSGFLTYYGTGRTPKGMSRAKFMSNAAQRAVDDLKQVGKFRRTTGGQLFYTMEKPTPLIVPLIEGDIRLQTLINDQFGVNAASANLFKHLVVAMQMEAHRHGAIIEVHQFCHANKETKTIYVSLLDGKRMIKLDGDVQFWDSLKIVANGTDGVYFLDDPSWEPWEPAITAVVDEETGVEFLEHEEGVARRYLVDPINFIESDRLDKEEQKWVFEMWLRCLLLDLEEKPLLFLCGPPGSGKTVAMQHVKKALFGRSGTVDLIRKEDAFNAAVTSTPFLVLDNLDDFHAKWLIGSLATASTGIAVQLRELYTTNDVVSVFPRAWIALTSTDSLFADNQPAIADRMIVLNMDRLGDGFGEKGQAEAVILKHRDEILTDLVFQLYNYVRIWRDSKEAKTSMRVAAFGLAVTRFASLNGGKGGKEKAELVFQKLRSSQGDLLSEHNSLFTALDEWFAGYPEAQSYSGTAGDVAETVRVLTNTKVSAVGMGRKLNSLKPLLQQRYRMTHDDGKTGSTRYTFYRPEVDGQKPEDAAGTTTPLETQVAAVA